MSKEFVRDFVPYNLEVNYLDEKKLEENENIKTSEGLVRLIFKEHDEFSVRAWHRTKNELRKHLRELKKLTKQQKKFLFSLKQNLMSEQLIQPSQDQNISAKSFKWMQASTSGSESESVHCIQQ